MTCKQCLYNTNLTKSTRSAQTSLAKADHYSHITHCKNVEPLWWKANPKGSGSLPTPRSCHATAIMISSCSFIHIWKPRSSPKFKQFFIVLPRTPSRHPHPHPQIKFHPNPFITFWVMLSTNRQTDRQTNTTKNITCFCQGGNKISLQSNTLGCSQPLTYLMYTN